MKQLVMGLQAKTRSETIVETAYGMHAVDMRYDGLDEFIGDETGQWLEEQEAKARMMPVIIEQAVA